MLTLINTNRMTPPIAPIGLAYTAAAARAGGIETHVLDLGLAEDPAGAMAEHFAQHQPRLVGLSFRNVDDCMWPSGEWFVPGLCELVSSLRGLTDAPIVIEIEVESRDEDTGVFVGPGAPIPMGRPVKIERTDPRAQGLPRGYPQVPTGCYIRAVDPPEETTLPDATVERLRALGYLD